MAKMKTLSISIDEKSLTKILKQVDKEAIEKNTNRSHILRKVILDGFGIERKDRHPRNYTRSMSIKAE